MKSSPDSISGRPGLGGREAVAIRPSGSHVLKKNDCANVELASAISVAANNVLVNFELTSFIMLVFVLFSLNFEFPRPSLIPSRKGQWSGEQDWFRVVIILF